MDRPAGIILIFARLTKLGTDAFYLQFTIHNEIIHCSKIIMIDCIQEASAEGCQGLIAGNPLQDRL